MIYLLTVTDVTTDGIQDWLSDIKSSRLMTSSAIDGVYLTALADILKFARTRYILLSYGRFMTPIYPS